jgi:hypothetical protein
MGAKPAVRRSSAALATCGFGQLHLAEHRADDQHRQRAPVPPQMYFMARR